MCVSLSLHGPELHCLFTSALLSGVFSVPPALSPFPQPFPHRLPPTAPAPADGAARSPAPHWEALGPVTRWHWEGAALSKWGQPSPQSQCPAGSLQRGSPRPCPVWVWCQPVDELVSLSDFSSLRALEIDAQVMQSTGFPEQFGQGNLNVPIFLEVSACSEQPGAELCRGRSWSCRWSPFHPTAVPALGPALSPPALCHEGRHTAKFLAAIAPGPLLSMLRFSQPQSVTVSGCLQPAQPPSCRGNSLATSCEASSGGDCIPAGVLVFLLVSLCSFSRAEASLNPPCNVLYTHPGSFTHGLACICCFFPSPLADAACLSPCAVCVSGGALPPPSCSCFIPSPSLSNTRVYVGF